MNVLRSIMASREEHHNKLQAFNNGERVTFERSAWLYMLNHGHANRDECEILYQNAEEICVRKRVEPVYPSYMVDPREKHRVMCFNPVTMRMECVAERTMRESREIMIAKRAKRRNSLTSL